MPEFAMMPDVACLVEAQRAYFRTGATLPLEGRIKALRGLYDTIVAREKDIHAALLADLGKGEMESYLCETGMILSEISHMLRHLRRYARTTRARTPLHIFPAKSRVLRRPLGVVLIMAPWNYPFLLTMDSLVGALAAGNCCILKPSADAPATHAVIREIIAACFPVEHVAVVAGHRDENQALLEQHFDKIFFTGGVVVGKEVLRRAAEHLTPTVLELGGKSPTVVTATAKIDLAVRRIAFGKMLNNGQTCVAPDYVLVHRSVADELTEKLAKTLPRMAADFGASEGSRVHMVNRHHYDRVMRLIAPEKAVIGGTGDPDTLTIAPTILRDVSPDAPVMQEEIFGPVLPILVYDDLQQAMDFINDRPTPLACYLFSQDRQEKRRFLQGVTFGGGCINDTIMHITSNHLPFGGKGSSGMGHYHGRYSFECFTHDEAVLETSALLDLPMRYPPYAPWKKRIFRSVLR